MIQDQSAATSNFISDFLRWAIEQIRKHGLPIVLFAAAVYYFYTEVREMKLEIRACNDALIETYRVNQVQMLDVINNNTRALQAVPRN
jgi:hypothetical protein